MGLHISFKNPFGKHSLLGGAAKTVGKLAPLAGLIPGVGTLGGAGIGALAKLIGGGNPIAGGLEGLAGGFASNKLGGLGGIAKTLGHAISRPNMLGNAEGNLDLGKLIGAGSAVAGTIGHGKQRRSAENYANARTSQLNALMSKILSGQNYGVPEQSSATPGY